MEEMVVILNELKVVSMGEIKHSGGVNLPRNEQFSIDDPDVKLRSIIEHFHNLHEMER